MSQPYEPVPLPDRANLSDEDMLARSREMLARLRRRHTVREFASRAVPREIIVNCIEAAGLAPSGANQQPWRFVLIGPGPLRRQLRDAAEAEERDFYAGRASAEWLDALGPLGTDATKPFLEDAPWLIAIFGQRYGVADGKRQKHYYVPESIGIATGFLISALHEAGLATLTHTPSPMGFLNEALARPENEKAYILLVVGHPADDATVPAHAKRKLPIETILIDR